MGWAVTKRAFEKLSVLLCRACLASLQGSRNWSAGGCMRNQTSRGMYWHLPPAPHEQHNNWNLTIQLPIICLTRQQSCGAGGVLMTTRRINCHGGI